jgi:hypothetical protein
VSHLKRDPLRRERRRSRQRRNLVVRERSQILPNDSDATMPSRNEVLRVMVGEKSRKKRDRERRSLPNELPSFASGF